jgi:hypothetical protein
MSIRLYRKDGGEAIGTITPAQLQVLVDLLEEESAEDRDYFVDADLLAYMEEQGADGDLVALLRAQLAGTDGIEIEWREE